MNGTERPVLDRTLIDILGNGQKFDLPQTGKAISQFDVCPKFKVRMTGVVPPLYDCFFCQHAYFGLEKEKALEEGICHYPTVIIK
jgi:hypothetical protein